MMDDQADLSHLNDIVVPPVIPWWPPAPGWWILFAAFIAAVLILFTAAILRWRANAYRRTALAELKKSDARGDPAAISAILKRTALVAYPRDTVAALTGNGWLQFLEQTSHHAKTTGHTTNITALVYGTSPRGRAALLSLARQWVEHHKAEAK